MHHEISVTHFGRQWTGLGSTVAEGAGSEDITRIGTVVTETV
jgi:hypothetical protein